MQDISSLVETSLFQSLPSSTWSSFIMIVYLLISFAMVVAIGSLVSILQTTEYSPNIQSTQCLIEALFTCLRQNTAWNRRKRLISDLPPEIVLHILSYLLVVPKACLVLSCKRFYHEFGYILESPELGYPYTHGLNSGTDYLKRKYFLLGLGHNGSFKKNWKYCAACLKLHPRSEFEVEDYVGLYGGRPLKEQCKWPGVIILCPCLKLSPRKINQLIHELRSSKDSNRADTEITNYIPHWHYCQFSSSSADLSYSLVISISLEETGLLVFHLVYSISFKQNYTGKRRLMLCPHRDAVEYLKTCPQTECYLETGYIRALGCFICGIKPSISVSENPGMYLIRYTRKYPEYPSGSGEHEICYRDRFTDYRWDRYVLSVLQYWLLITDIDSSKELR